MARGDDIWVAVLAGGFGYLGGSFSQWCRTLRPHICSPLGVWGGGEWGQVAGCLLIYVSSVGLLFYVSSLVLQFYEPPPKWPCRFLDCLCSSRRSRTTSAPCLNMAASILFARTQTKTPNKLEKNRPNKLNKHVKRS